MAERKADIVNFSNRELVRGDLILRLERLGAADDANLDRVEKYMALWDLAMAYVEDRTSRGLYVTEINGNGKETFKLNASATELVKVCAQMDKLYNSIQDAKPKVAPKDEPDAEL